MDDDQLEIRTWDHEAWNPATRTIVIRNDSTPAEARSALARD